MAFTVLTVPNNSPYRAVKALFRSWRWPGVGPAVDQQHGLAGVMTELQVALAENDGDDGQIGQRAFTDVPGHHGLVGIPTRFRRVGTAAAQDVVGADFHVITGNGR